MNLSLPVIQSLNPIFRDCSPLDFNKKEINAATLAFERDLHEKLLVLDLDGCEILLKDFMKVLEDYFYNQKKLNYSHGPAIKQYLTRFADQFSQALHRTVKKTSVFDVPDGNIVATLKHEIVDNINILLQPDVTYVKSKNPRIDFGGYDRCKIFKKRRLLNSYSKLGRLENMLKVDPNYQKYVYNKGFGLHSFTLHYSTSEDVVHYQFGLWRDPQNRKKLSAKYLQCHYDPDPENIKSILYLSSVKDLTQGPFKYIDGSSEISVVNILERVSGATMCGINLLETYEKRLFFSSLPDRLMHHNIFGSLLEQQQLDEINLDKLLRPIYGDAGTFILFDPLGIHSGGFCTENASRLNLQMIFKKR